MPRRVWTLQTIQREFPFVVSLIQQTLEEMDGDVRNGARESLAAQRYGRMREMFGRPDKPVRIYLHRLTDVKFFESLPDGAGDQLRQALTELSLRDRRLLFSDTLQKYREKFPAPTGLETLFSPQTATTEPATA